MKIVFAEPSLPKSGSLVVGVLDDRKLTPSAQRVDKATGGMLTRAMEASRFKGRKDDVLAVLAPGGLDVARVILLGLGKPASLDATALAERRRPDRGAAQQRRRNRGAGGDRQDRRRANCRLRKPPPSSPMARGCAPTASTSTAPRKSRSRSRASQTLTVAVEQARRREKEIRRCSTRSRTPCSSPATSSPSRPTSSIPRRWPSARAELEELGVEVEILKPKDMKKLGMGALLGVGQGSEHAPRLLVMQWKGAPHAKDKRPIAFVGKGVTFDTGGISIKPAGGMEDMKWDMAGAGVVIGAMRALGRTQGQGQRGRHRRPGREHAVGHGAAAGRHRHLDVGPDHRGAQHRRRRPARAGRRAVVLPGPVQAAIHGRSRDADRRHHHRARQRICRHVFERRQAGEAARRRRARRSARSCGACRSATATTG